MICHVTLSSSMLLCKPVPIVQHWLCRFRWVGTLWSCRRRARRITEIVFNTRSQVVCTHSIWFVCVVVYWRGCRCVGGWFKICNTVSVAVFGWDGWTLFGLLCTL